MKRNLLLSVICLILSAFFANTVFADYLGPNQELRTYTGFTVGQVSILGIYVHFFGDTASPAGTPGPYCDISGSQTPDGMTPPEVIFCAFFEGATGSVTTGTACEYNAVSASTRRNMLTMLLRISVDT